MYIVCVHTLLVDFEEPNTGVYIWNTGKGIQISDTRNI